MTRLLLALASAALLAASMLRSSLWPLAGVALVPWLIATQRAGRLESLALGAIAGTVFGCLVVAWIPEALRALGSSNATSLGGLLLTAAWAKAALFAAVGLLARELPRAPAWAAIGLLGAFFGCGEAWISASSWGVPGALLGHSQLPALGVVQLAVVGGVPLVSAWLASLNMAIALGFLGVRGARPLAAGLAVGWLALAGVGLRVAELARAPAVESRTEELLIIQPEVPRYARWVPEAQPSVLESVAAYTDEALASEASPVDAIVWPENLLTTRIDAAPELALRLQLHVDRWGIPLITGVVRSASREAGHAYRSSIVWIEPARGITSGIDKVRAVPLLESNWAFPGAAPLRRLFGEAASGPKVEEVLSAGALTGRFTLTPVLCYEVLFPGIVAERRPPESLAILNLADDSWVEGESATRQLSAWARFRAIEQRLMLIRVAHGGLSFAADEYGRILTALPLDRFAHARVSVHASAPPTFAEKTAIFSVALVPGLVVGYALSRMKA